MSCSVRRRKGRAPRAGGGSERSERGGVGVVRKKRFARGRSPTREPYNLPPAKLSFMGGVIICRHDGLVRKSVRIRLSIYKLLFLTLPRAAIAKSDKRTVTGCVRPVDGLPVPHADPGFFMSSFSIIITACP